MNGDSVFLSYIRMVLKRWTGLQLAITEGMGGLYAKEKEIWFGEEIEKYFKNNDNLAAYEVEDFMATILDAEFDTVAEDGSLEEISKDFCKVFEMCMTGSESEVQKLLPKLETPPNSVVLSTAACIDQAVEEMGMPQIDRLRVTEESAVQEDVSDGWTVVHGGRRRK